MSAEDLTRERTIHQVLKRQAERHGERTFFWFRDRAFSYRDFDREWDLLSGFAIMRGAACGPPRFFSGLLAHGAEGGEELAADLDQEIHVLGAGFPFHGAEGVDPGERFAQ